MKNLIISYLILCCTSVLLCPTADLNCINIDNENTLEVTMQAINQIMQMNFITDKELPTISRCSSRLREMMEPFLNNKIHTFMDTILLDIFSAPDGASDSVKAIYKALEGMDLRYSFESYGLDRGIYELQGYHYTLVNYYKRVKQAIADGKNRVYVDFQDERSLLNLRNMHKIHELLNAAKTANDIEESHKEALEKFLSVMVWVRNRNTKNLLYQFVVYCNNS